MPTALASRWKTADQVAHQLRRSRPAPPRFFRCCGFAIGPDKRRMSRVNTLARGIWFATLTTILPLGICGYKLQVPTINLVGTFVASLFIQARWLALGSSITSGAVLMAVMASVTILVRSTMEWLKLTYCPISRCMRSPSSSSFWRIP
jgi:hypothetical protein